jgi:predicted MPP superfamily phosphohydrolase
LRWRRNDIVTPPGGSCPALDNLQTRLGAFYLRQRLGIEAAHESYVSRRRLGAKKWRSEAVIIRTALKASGLYWRGHRNAARVELRRNIVWLRRLPSAFEGFTILHLSDLHADTNPAAMQALPRLLPQARYDLCVLTGDLRGRTFGRFDTTLAEIAGLREHLREPIYGVLGNHDTIRMVPALEELGIRLLINESATIRRGDQVLHLAGIDDAHYYRTHNIEKAAGHLPPDECAILLSHSPEVYRQAAHAGFDLMLSGHTHSGQICLPGGVPLHLNSRVRRGIGSGAWSYYGMAGYTSAGVGSSIVIARFNCPPEITLHELRAAADEPP